MSDLSISQGSPFEAGRTPCPQGGEDLWSARRLMVQMGYDKWERFEGVIERAKVAAHNQGFNVNILFKANREKRDAAVLPGSGKNLGGRPSTDYMVTRFAAYLIAMNGDPRKTEVAAAQAYFAVKTREAEVAQPELSEDEIVHRALQIQTRKVKELEAKIEADATKVAYIDGFVADEDLIKFRVVANQLNIDESRIREILIEHNWIYRETWTRWSNSKQQKEIIYQYRAYADKKKYFRLRPRHEAPRVGGELQQTLYLTPAGSAAVLRAFERWDVAA